MRTTDRRDRSPRGHCGSVTRYLDHAEAGGPSLDIGGSDVPAADDQAEVRVRAHALDDLPRRRDDAPRGRLDPQLRLLGERDHAGHGVRVGDDEDLVDERLDVRERALRDVRRAQRARHGRRCDRHRLAGGQRAGHRVGALGLHTPDTNARVVRPERRCDPGDERAAADAHEHVGQPRRRLSELESDGALPGDHERVVEGVDQRHAAGDELVEERERAGHVLAQPQVGAGRPDALDRAGGRAARHHDRRPHVHARRHVGHGDPVVAAADGDHAGRSLSRVERKELVRNPARLEGPRALQQLELEGDRDPEMRGEPRARDGWGQHDVLGDPLGGGGDVVQAQQRGHPAHGIRHAVGVAEPLISVRELAERVAADAPPVLLDVRWSLEGPDPDGFRAGHIPSARFVDLDAELSGPPGAGGRHPLPDTAAFQAAMRRHGVSDDHEVVIYDAGSGALGAARAWWLLRYMGHRCPSVLDGGLAAWRAADLPLASEPDSEVVPGDFTAEPGTLTVLDADGASDFAQRGTLLDVRVAERFRGEHEPIDSVAGRIPGAVSAPAGELTAEDCTWLSPELLRARFERLGDGPYAAYCGSGVTAAQTILALERAGLRGALYAGSWSDWITDPGRPVKNG